MKPVSFFLGLSFAAFVYPFCSNKTFAQADEISNFNKDKKNNPHTNQLRDNPSTFPKPNKNLSPSKTLSTIAQSQKEAQKFEAFGESKKAESILLSNLDRAKTLPYPLRESAIGSALNELGSFHLRRLRFSKAIKYLEQSLPLARKQNDVSCLVVVLSNLAEAYLGNADVQTAENFLLEAISLSRISCTDLLPYMVNTHVEILKRRGEYNEAAGEILGVLKFAVDDEDIAIELTYKLLSLGFGNILKSESELSL